jgi:hypothetical protein
MLSVAGGELRNTITIIINCASLLFFKHPKVFTVRYSLLSIYLYY